MNLAIYTAANKEFFDKGKAPSKKVWLDWIERNVVKGKIIDGSPYVDMSWFAANDIMKEVDIKKSGIDLLAA